MKVGDYVRTEYGIIDKYSPVWVEHNEFEDRYYYVYPDKEEYYDHKELIIKSSPNIIDLIEVGDYVNGEKVIRLFNPTFLSIGELPYVITDKSNYEPQEIKSIVTKEQFESMKYKIEEE